MSMPLSSRRTSRGAMSMLCILAMTLTICRLSTGDAQAAIFESKAQPLGYFPLAVPLQALVPTSIEGGQAVDVQITGRAGLPSNAADVSSVVVNVTLSNATSNASALVGAGAATDAQMVIISYSAARVTASQAAPRLSTDGKIRVKSSAPLAKFVTVEVNVVGYTATQRGCGQSCFYHHRYHASNGAAVLDPTPFALNRSGQTATDGVQSVQITGKAGVPSSATEAVVRISTLQPTNGMSTLPRQLHVKPTTASGVSTLLGIHNWNEASVSSRVVTTTLSQTGGIVIVLPASDHVPAPGQPQTYRNLPSASDPEGAQAILMVDVLGWFNSSNAYAPARTGSARTINVKHGEPQSFDIRGRDGLPVVSGSGAPLAAVTLGLTATAPSTIKTGAISAGSNLRHVEFEPGQTVTNQVTVPVDSTGNVQFTYKFNDGTPDNVVTSDIVALDFVITGWYEWSGNSGYSTGAKYVPVSPTRAHITSTWQEGALTFPSFKVTEIGGSSGVPKTGVTSVALQIRAWNAAGPTSLTVFAPGRTTATTPHLHVAPGLPASQLVFGEVSADGKVGVLIGTQAVAIEVTVVGYFTRFVGNGPQTSNALIVGDSITFGSTPSIFSAVSDTTNSEIDTTKNQTNINGLSGHQAHELRFLVNRFMAARPEQLVVNLGTNDAWIGPLTDPTQQAARTQADLERIVDDQPNATCRYFVTINTWTTQRQNRLSGHTRMTDRATAINTRIVDLSKNGEPGGTAYRSKVGVIDFDKYVRALEPVADPPGDGNNINNNDYVLMADDGLHPKASGQAALAGLYRYALTGLSDQLPPGINGSSYVTRCP